MPDDPHDPFGPRGIEDLPGTLPLFPLRNAILLPRGHLPLNIFEPRYLSMVDHALRHGRQVGMIRPRQEEGMNPPLYEVGCAGRISSFSETEDGRLLITLTGLSRFRLKEDRLSDQGFRFGDVDWGPFANDLVPPPEDEDPTLTEHMLGPLSAYLEAMGLSADWDSIDGSPAEPVLNSVAMSCPFLPDEQQALLEAPTLPDRVQTLIALMEMATAAVRQDAGDDGGGRLQ